MIHNKICILFLFLIVLIIFLLQKNREGYQTKSALECYTEKNAQDYRGIVNTTKDGKVCIKWDQAKEYQKIGYWTGDKDASKYGIGNHNFCRNPETDIAPAENTAWCYTKDSNFGKCDVGNPSKACPKATTATTTPKATEPTLECYTEKNAQDYRGSVNKTKDGNVCIKWDQQIKSDGKIGYWTGYSDASKYGIGKHNFCRNPGAAREDTAWCYINDTNPRWGECDVGNPSKTCTKETTSTTTPKATTATTTPKATTATTTPKATQATTPPTISNAIGRDWVNFGP